GILICSSCGASLANSTVNKGKLSYFQCYKFTKGICQESHYVNAKAAEQSVVTGLEAVLESRNIYHLNIIKSSQSDDEIALLNKAVSKLDGKLTKIKDAYIDGIDTLEEYKENKQRILQERDQLMAKIQELSEASPAALSKEDSIEKLLDNIRLSLEILKDENATQTEKGNAIRNIVEKIVYDKSDNSYAFYYYSHG
ncbi:MAG: recombinase zinc beta ribbon domain-containing protein, partial [Lachnospiraceae bacterium]|nr:recombinase zinc beta ribbon domain-containing protein [Lachnospiraceae bacterium]